MFLAHSFVVENGPEYSLRIYTRIYL